MRLINSLFCLLIFVIPVNAMAIEFSIYQSGYKPLQLAWVIDAETSANSESSLVHDIVQNDLVSSQSFTALNPLSFLDSAADTWQQVEYSDWRLIGADILAICRLSATPNGWQAQIQVHDPFREKMLGKTTLTAPPGNLRTLAHRISNYVYKTALGIPGYFLSRIAYVRKTGSHSELITMDQDGANKQVVARHFSILLSPDWSPDRNFIALNDYAGDQPRVQVLNVQTGTRDTIADFNGLNSTPAFSPDGRYIAATLSFSGNPGIYIFDLKTRHWRPFTHSPNSIDTSPTWSPDGKWIAFTSNRDGSPQIYRKSLETGEVHRVSLVGTYNTSPSWSPKGDRIAMISLKNWEYAVATVNVDGSDIRYLASGRQVESPSWSPNAQMLIYAGELNGIRQLFEVPSWGGQPEEITTVNEDASDPAWSR